MNTKPKPEHTISVIVPKNPFLKPDLNKVGHCLAAIDVEKLMEWWPGNPHTPNRNPEKVRSIQRSLDWKRVVQIAAYLLQQEVTDAQERVDKYFKDIYEPRKYEQGRQWPPRIPRVASFNRSEYPTFSNVLLHVNGAKIELIKNTGAEQKAATLSFNPTDQELNFSVIDGQHRINGAFLAIKIRQELHKNAAWEIPAEIFLDLDKPGAPPRHQAQIFIDVNYNQKKVDRSLVADLFPTARSHRSALDNKERAQDLGRKLMLEIGPLVGMIQIPGIRFGAKDVVTLATLNSSIEEILDALFEAGISTLDDQAEFLAQCLNAWLIASGRKEQQTPLVSLDPQNVAYQGRVLVAFLTMIPVCIMQAKKASKIWVSQKSEQALTDWIRGTIIRAGLVQDGKFLSKADFRKRDYLGSGGIARFRDRLWAAALSEKKIGALSDEKISKLAAENRGSFHRKS